MNWFSNLHFRSKLLVTHLGVVLITALTITILITSQVAGLLHENGTSNLALVTEQVLINYTTAVENTQQHLYSMGVSTGMVQTAGTVAADAVLSSQKRAALIFSLSNMVDSRATYDSVTIQLLNGDMVSSDDSYNRHRLALLSQAVLTEHTEKQYGKTKWLRDDNGEVYLVRDLYATSPLRYIGKICAHIRQDAIVTMSDSNRRQGTSFVLLNSDNELVLTTNDQTAIVDTARQLVQNTIPVPYVNDTRYATCVMEREGWKIVGLMPMSIIENIQWSVRSSGALSAILGVLIGLFAAIILSRQLALRVKELVASMKRVEAGELDVEIAVRYRDEIGQLAEHFNRMTRKTRELLQKIVQEEKSKRQAEYMNLEYEYRFLQWQVNPHFIYNSLETINAFAKMDGDEALSEQIILLSEYFRENAEAIRKKFVTVEHEFYSLSHYAQIYKVNYGNNLNAEFAIDPSAEGAYLPTMIIQPLLENALVHSNIRGRSTTIRTTAKAEDGRLIVCIRDNGPGMTQETIDRILSCHAASAKEDTRTSLGVRNVLDRMHLLYGDEGKMDIQSEVGRGTCVSVCFPLRFQGDALPFESSRMQAADDT